MKLPIGAIVCSSSISDNVCSPVMNSAIVIWAENGYFLSGGAGKNGRPLQFHAQPIQLILWLNCQAKSWVRQIMPEGAILNRERPNGRDDGFEFAPMRIADRPWQWDRQANMRIACGL